MIPTILLLSACGGGADAATAPEAALPDLPPSACTAEPHDWLPLDGMGALVDETRADELSLGADAVRAALAAYGLGGLEDLVAHDVETWRVRYATQDRGEAVEATGLVAVPADAGDYPVLLWLHPTMGFSDACAPSALGLEGAAFPVLFASMGFAVAAPDYLGMAGWGAPSGRLHPYVVAEPTAVASLDAVRALLRLADEAPLEARPDPARVVHWGASEGGFAALWTDRYLRGYAPELSSAAVVAAVAPTDMPALAAIGLSTFSDTTFALAAVVVAEREWAGWGDLEDALVPEVAAALPGEMAESCEDFPSVAGAGAVTDVFADSFVEAAAADPDALPDPFGCLLREARVVGSAVEGGGEAPLLLVLGEEDRLVWPGPTRDDVAGLCAEGYEVELVECAGAGHVDAAVDTLPEQLGWILDRLDGLPLEAPCEVGEPVACGGG